MVVRSSAVVVSEELLTVLPCAFKTAVIVSPETYSTGFAIALSYAADNLL